MPGAPREGERRGAGGWSGVVFVSWDSLRLLAKLGELALEAGRVPGIGIVELFLHRLQNAGETGARPPWIPRLEPRHQTVEGQESLLGGCRIGHREGVRILGDGNQQALDVGVVPARLLQTGSDVSEGTADALGGLGDLGGRGAEAGGLV